MATVWQPMATMGRCSMSPQENITTHIHVHAVTGVRLCTFLLRQQSIPRLYGNIVMPIKGKTCSGNALTPVEPLHFRGDTGVLAQYVLVCIAILKKYLSSLLDCEITINHS